MKKLLLALVAFILALATSSPVLAADQYIRVSNVSMLHDGDEVIIVSAKYGVAMSKFQTKNYMEPCSIVFAADSLTASVPTDSVAVLTLNQYSGKWRLYNEDRGWLYATNATNSDIGFTDTKTPSKGSTILDLTFDIYANAFLSFNVSNYKYLKYRHQSLRFARYQYTSSNDHIQLYRRLKNNKIIERLSLSELSDDAQLDADDADAFVKRVVVDRTFSADGGYHTLCLPFDITETDAQTVLGGAQLKCLTAIEKPDADKLLLHFLTVRSVEAGTPCLLKLPFNAADIVAPEFTDKFLLAVEPATVTMKIDGTIVDFIGTYSPTLLPADGCYRFLSADGSRLVTPNANGELKGLRAYFRFSAPMASTDFDSGGIPKTIAVAVDGEELSPNEATAICEMWQRGDGVGQCGSGYNPFGEAKVGTPLFTLSGMRIDSGATRLKPGIYITSNGHKIVVK